MAIGRILGIAGGRDMAQRSRVLMQSGSGARVGVVKVVYYKEIAHSIRNRHTLVPGTCLADTKKPCDCTRLTPKSCGNQCNLMVS